MKAAWPHHQNPRRDPDKIHPRDKMDWAPSWRTQRGEKLHFHISLLFEMPQNWEDTWITELSAALSGPDGGAPFYQASLFELPWRDKCSRGGAMEDSLCETSSAENEAAFRRRWRRLVQSEEGAKALGKARSDGSGPAVRTDQLSGWDANDHSYRVAT